MSEKVRLSIDGDPDNFGFYLIPPGIKVASQEQRRRTPLAFAQWLIEVAGRCKR